MFDALPSAGKLRRLNRRQRKKRCVGEFQELAFEVRVHFKSPLELAAISVFVDGMMTFAEARGLMAAGFGGAPPISETEGFVSAWGRGSPSAEDRQAVLDWLQRHPDVAAAEAGEFVDAWYGWVTTGSPIPQ